MIRKFGPDIVVTHYFSIPFAFGVNIFFPVSHLSLNGSSEIWVLGLFSCLLGRFGFWVRLPVYLGI